MKILLILLISVNLFAKVNKGEIPKCRVSGFEDWRCADWVPLAFGEVHVWTFNNTNPKAWRISIGEADRTGAAQCSLTKMVVIPPAGLDIRKSKGTNNTTTYMFPDRRPLPMGIYKIRIKNLSYDTCKVKYEIKANIFI